jgi:outer membrane protein TolC
VPTRRYRSIGVGALLAGLGLTGCAHYDYAHYEAKPLVPAATATALEARSLDDPGLRKFLTENLHRDFSSGPPVGWDFETLCWVAFYFNPSLDVARAQWEAARAAQTTAGARANPAITLTPGFSANPTGTSPWIPAINLNLPLEPAALRDRRAEVARLNTEVARQTLLGAAWQVRGDLRRALLDLKAADSRVEHLRPQVDANRQILALLEQRRTAGAATAADVGAARLALVRVETAVAEAESQAGPARPRVAQALGLPVSALAALGPLPAPDAGPSVATPGALATARRQALLSRPEVLAALARYAVAEGAVALEVERQHPGLQLGPGYQFDEGENKWTVAFTFDLPLFNHNEGPLAEAEAHRHEAAAQLATAQAQVLAEIDAATATLEAATRQIPGRLPARDELQKQLELTEARLKAGAADQLEVLNARVELAAEEQALADLTVQADQAAGQLEDALQISLTRLDPLAPASPPPAPTAKMP